MDGSLDDPLARMHRWEALRQKLAVSRGEHLEPVVGEVVDALEEIVHRRAPVAVTVIVEDDRVRAGVRLAWRDERLVVSRVDPAQLRGEPDDAPVERTRRVNGAAAPAASPAAPDPGASPDTAARLAELIRRDPSLLEQPDPWDRG